MLNKCDLIPTWATARWVKVLSKDFPTLAFHASITNPFGKGALIQLLRQFAKLHSDKKQISVGFIGYPNVGKSSVINTLRSKKVCNVAPIPGETKVWQYITLFKRIFLIDCPGVVYPSGDNESDIVLKGVVRIENLTHPEDFIDPVLERVKKEYVSSTYGIDSWTDVTDFLNQYAKKSGKLLKGAEPDTATVAKMILNDWQRGKIPYFCCPPFEDQEEPKKEEETVDPLLRDIAQNFKRISVVAKFTNQDNAIPDALRGIELNQQKVRNTTDWDEVLANVEPDDNLDTIDDIPGASKKVAPNKKDEDPEDSDADDIYDQMVTDKMTVEEEQEDEEKAEQPAPVEEIDITKALNEEFASDSDEDDGPTGQKEKFIVLNPKRTFLLFKTFLYLF